MTLRLLFSRSAAEMTAQAWILAMRRIYAQEVNAAAVESYVSDALTRQGEAPIRPGVVAELIGLALYGVPPQRVRRHERALVLPILGEAVRTGFTSVEDLAELIRPMGGGWRACAARPDGRCATRPLCRLRAVRGR